MSAALDDYPKVWERKPVLRTVYEGFYRLISDVGVPVTTILVTHDQIEALSFADQIAVRREGRLLQVGPPRELYLHPRDPVIADSMGHAIVLAAQLGEGVADCPLGRIPIANCDRRGAAQIMLRPEQVKFVVVSEQGLQTSGEPRGCVGEVVGVEFGGSTCTVAVLLLGAAAEIDPKREPLLLLASPIATPLPGAIVRITVTGEAHVFPN